MLSGSQTFFHFFSFYLTLWHFGTVLSISSFFEFSSLFTCFIAPHHRHQHRLFASQSAWTCYVSWDASVNTTGPPVYTAMNLVWALVNWLLWKTCNTGLCVVAQNHLLNQPFPHQQYLCPNSFSVFQSHVWTARASSCSSFRNILLQPPVSNLDPKHRPLKCSQSNCSADILHA